MNRHSWIVVALFLATCPSIQAQPKEDPKSAAAVEYQKGVAALNLGNYDESAKSFESAYKLYQDPILLYNVAQSYRMGGDLKKALTVYQSYLREAPADAPERKSAEDRISGIKRELDERKAASTVVQTAPQMAPVPSPPPAPTLVVQAETPVVRDNPPWYRSRWVWVAGGTAVAAVATTLIVVYANHDRYPNNTLGTQPIGN